MIPIRDINHTRRTPIVTWAIIGANLLVFMLSLSLDRAETETLVMRFGVIPDVIVNGNWTAPRIDGGALGSWVTPYT
ncbi:MAG: hypothetical protein WBN29_11760, partial [Polyangiales bacterium]